MIETPARTFDEFCAERTIAQDEREALVWHLAAFRARKTVERLLPEQPPFDISRVLRGQLSKKQEGGNGDG